MKSPLLAARVRNNGTHTHTQGSNTLKSLGEIVRRGQGDAFSSTLRVGGTEFHTLRPTINSNAVLADHVDRAEANAKVTHTRESSFY
jgi:hypothetical protein